MRAYLITLSLMLIGCDSDDRLKQADFLSPHDQNANEAALTTYLEIVKMRGEGLYWLQVGMSYTFYTITIPCNQSARDWAAQNWDTYGFNYDVEKTHETVCAWAIESDDSLEDELDADGIKYAKYEVDDLDSFFDL